ncbi:hypothetical protein [Uliginosibacterium sp. TH139]|uniref:hypothetical protein n=1 Tax=Uliginosibacterium sp. TH139 TaxID=2067453 RepID=UPI000C798D8C|nr:hypothetical protein [Uliginosibacterium sp. TH139]PLK50534.1 hypothetical protein C0V76_01545 [Uliginosibacterium sp. TH139]
MLLLRLLTLLFCLTNLPATAASLFWCNGRFLDPAAKPFDNQHLKVAQRGYLYAVAAALVLQQDNAESRAHYFSRPERLREIDRPRRDRSGFEAAAFEVLDAPGGRPKELVIAFAGSNDNADWQNTNFGFDTRQYTLARAYFKRLASRPEYAGLRVIASGFSLGGALAVHVTKHHDTRTLVSETWAFNPSPKIYASNRQDPRIWLAATANDGVGLAREWAAAAGLLPGLASIGAPASQRAEGYYLLDANPVISHYRWVLTRNLLHAADLAVQEEQGPDAPSEPLAILEASHFSACAKGRH